MIRRSLVLSMLCFMLATGTGYAQAPCIGTAQHHCSGNKGDSTLEGVDFNGRWFRSLSAEQQKRVREKYASLFGAHHLSKEDIPEKPRLAELGKSIDEIKDDWFFKARRGDTSGINDLIDRGFDLNAKDAHGYTALILATYHDHIKTVEDLIEHGADPCLPDNKGNTALMGAAFKGFDSLIHQLKSAGCSINDQNAVGQTGLMMAALYGRTNTVKEMLSMGANPNIADQAGATAMSLALSQGNTEVIELLKPYTKQQYSSLLYRLFAKIKVAIEGSK